MKLLKNLTAIWIIIVTYFKFRKRLRPLEDLRKSGNYEEERALIAQLSHEISEYLCMRFRVNVTIRGEENIPQGACLFVANHQAFCDVVVLLLAMNEHQTGFISKSEQKNIPFMKTLMNMNRGLFLIRQNPREAVKTINKGVELLKEGFSLVIFPEGTRSQCEKMRSFKAGSFKLATRANVPVVPITLSGTFHQFEENGVISPADVTIVVHPPIDVPSMSPDQYNHIHKLAEKTIRDELENITGMDSHYLPEPVHD